MNKILITAILILGLQSLQAQQAAVPKNIRYDFLHSEYDFGKIAQGRPVTFDFKWVNTGKEPLQIRDVQAACGCTTPEWQSEPVKPGDTSTIKVGYNSAAEGAFDKIVTIYFNNEQKILRIKGTVYPSPATSAPLNASVVLLKQNN
ncbi:MAG: DUF1573 domain-containing protein [Flavitalea sp.]